MLAIGFDVGVFITAFVDRPSIEDPLDLHGVKLLISLRRMAFGVEHFR